MRKKDDNMMLSASDDSLDDLDDDSEDSILEDFHELFVN